MKLSFKFKLIATIFVCCIFQSRATIYTVGSGTTQTTSTTQTPFSNAVSDARKQYIIKASELTSQGVTFGDITSLAFNVGTTFNSATLNSFNIKIKQTSANVLTGTFDDIGLTTVFSSNVSITASGWKTFSFTSNFFWNGMDNLLVEICYNNSATTGTSTSVIATTNLIQYCQAASGTTTSVGCNLGPAATLVNTRPNMQLNIIPVVCNGIPQAGTISGTTSICLLPTANISLALNNYQIANGISRQWFSSATSSGPWAIMAGSTGTSVNTTITQTTYFICRSYCSFTNDSAATPAYQVTGTPHYNCMCSETIQDAEVNITNFTINSVSNSSTCTHASYNDYTGLTPVSVAAGSTVNYSITLTACYLVDSLPANYIYHLYVGVDFQHDGTVDYLGGTSYVGIAPGSTQTYSGSFTIPVNSLAGLTGIRIGNIYCNHFPYNPDETETYLIDILPLVPCNGSPVLSNLTGNDSVCSGISFTLQNTYNPVAGVSYQWQSAPVAGNFTDIAGATDSTSLTTSQTQVKRYRLRAICNATNDTDYTAEKTVTLSGLLSCYCIPVGENGFTDKLVRVRLNEIDNNFSVRPGNPPGYNIYYSPVAQIYKGTTNNLIVNAYGDYMNTHDMFVFIDYDHDGVFQPSERMTAISGGPDDMVVDLEVPINIPPSALNGLTRMRVRVLRVGSISPCGGSSHSQTGDYYVNINEAPSPLLNLKMFVEGSYSGGTLSPALYNNGLSADSTMGDSITVALHYPSSPFAVAYSTTGIFDINGNVSLGFPVASFGNFYYISMKTRNSVETWSNNPVRLYPAIKDFDFKQ
ncbi:MAG: GEVED domain-containing protein [Bacteroidota bacterium]